MHISIEGADGVGKTSTAQLLATRLGYRFVQKPIHLLFENDKDLIQYGIIRKKIEALNSLEIKVLFYGLGNLIVSKMSQDENIVTDRHVLSTYFWNVRYNTNEFFQSVIALTGKPHITILLYASMEVCNSRIISRSQDDKDIFKLKRHYELYTTMKQCLIKYNLPYIIVDNSNMSLNETVDYILQNLNINCLCNN